QAAIAHVFVESEGGRWFWLQQALVSRGAAFVRPRADNHARTQERLPIEHHARASGRGLRRRREHHALDATAAARAAKAANVSCTSREAPYRIVKGRIAAIEFGGDRAELALEGAAFALVV